MVRYISLIFTLGIFCLANGQDTLYLDINAAVKLARLNTSTHKNSTLSELLIDNTSRLSGIKVPPTEFKYKYGQLYTPEKGWKFEVDQKFGNIVQNLRNRELEDIARLINQKENQLQIKSLELQIKSVYLNWIYLYNLAENIGILKEYLAKSLYVSSVRHDLGETEFLEDLHVQTRMSELDLQYAECQINIEMTRNELKRLVNTTAFIVPVNRKLEMYMVGKKYDTSAYNGNYISDVYLQKYNYSTTNVKSKKAAYSPSVSAGLFLQNINKGSSLTGVQAGISIPIWYLPNKAEVEKTKIESEKAYNDYTQVLNSSKLKIENLLLQLDKSFLRIRHYQNFAIPTANHQINTTVAKYQAEEIEYNTYVNLITEALLIKREYLETINNYNQTAVELELYTK